MIWPNWLVSLVNSLPTAISLQDKLEAGNAKRQSLTDENVKLKDDLRLCNKKVQELERELDQLQPGAVDSGSEMILYFMAGHNDDEIDPDEIAESLKINRHEARLRLDGLFRQGYIQWSQGRCRLTRKVLTYLRHQGALSELDGLEQNPDVSDLQTEAKESKQRQED